MKYFLKIIIILIFFCQISNARDTDYSRYHSTSLKSFIEEVLFSRIAPEVQYGIYIERLDTKKVIYEKDAHVLFQPASNRKIMTAAFALANLTPNFVYETPIYISGNIEEEKLIGNIIVKANGDPSFHPIYDPRRFYAYPFNDWAKQISDKGIKSIRGDIIIDVSCFEKFDFIPSGWSWEQLKDSYASPIGAFSVFENCITLKISPGSASGEQVNFSMIPEIPNFNIENLTKTNGGTGFGNVDITKSPTENKYLLTGRMGLAAKPQTLRVPLTNPDVQVAEIFKAILEKEGIMCSGKIKIVYDSKEIDYSSANLLFKQTSPDIKRLIKYMLLESNNFFAEQIYKTVSATKGGKGSYENSKTMERRLWSSWGLPIREINPADGSGLSRANLVSPFFIAELLKKIRERRPDWEFENLLPANGISGTLKGRVSKQPYVNKVKAKTGSLLRVSCLSGYIYTESQIPIVFSIMINNSIGEMGGKMIFIEDKICERLIREEF